MDTSRSAPALLASLDAVILVVEIGRTTVAEVRAALRLFGGIGLVGVVLTRPEARRFRLG